MKSNVYNLFRIYENFTYYLSHISFFLNLSKLVKIGLSSLSCKTWSKISKQKCNYNYWSS